MKLRLAIVSLFILKGIFSFAGIKPDELTCEYMKNPQVVDEEQPRLSWINIAENQENGQAQTAWQIRVATSEAKLRAPDLWDSGKVPGSESFRVIYNGKKLKSRQECWWQVRVWDKDGKVSQWSEPAFWRMGLLDPSDWIATWIGAPWQGEEALPKPMNPNAPLPELLPPPAPMFRKVFSVQKKIKKAVAFITGLGYFEFYLNGKKVGNDELVPNQTNYGKRPNLLQQNIPLPDHFREYRVMYLAYDISGYLSKGKNCAGSILGNGFYNPAKYWAEGYGTPRFLAQIHIEYSDGTEEVIVSDKSWKAAKSPLLMDMVYYGEHYDARLEQPGWNAPEFDDSQWQKAVERKAPEGKLVAHTAPTDKVMEQIKPAKIEKLRNGNYRVDFGVEISGRVRLKNMEGPAGHKIGIKYLSNTYSGDNSYIFSGKGNENYASRFNWFVFSAVEIENWPGELKPGQITAEMIYTDVKESAVFETSNPLFNQINEIWKRSQKDNMHGGIASDCPHRERSAYTGDGQVACATVMHNFDARAFYHKWIHDIIGAQIIETGYVPNGAPWQPGCGGGVGWGAAICIMPWEFYLQFGALDILKDSYPAMKEYIRYMLTWVDEAGIMLSQRTGRDGKVLRWFNLGDWVPPGKLPPDEMVHTFFLWQCADLTAKSAKALGFEKEAQDYAQLAGKTKAAFQKRFYNPQKGSCGPAGGNIFALKMGVPPEQYDKVISALKEDINSNDGHLDTGIFGTRFFFEVLSENGLHNLAYEAMNKKDEPGFGYWIEQGATTTWEKWNGGGSHNHPMFGGGLTWFYRNLAGMKPDENDPGYRHIIFKPMPVDEVDYVTYSNQTSYGEAGIHWENPENGFNVEVTVPVGCRATVFVPAKENQQILSPEAAVLAGSENGYQLFKIGSGVYRFKVK